jgi:hypothetical protein
MLACPRTWRLFTARTMNKTVVASWIRLASRGAREIVRWYTEDPSRQVVDQKLDALMDKLAAGFGVA